MITKYPTKKEILNNLIEPEKEIIDLLRGWMATSWKASKSENEKFLALRELISKISKYYKKPVEVVYKPLIPSCCYFPFKKTIFLNKSLSIISSLHELGHHLHGHSELAACTWSISYFKVAFPNSYDKLKWKGHLLIKAK